MWASALVSAGAAAHNILLQSSGELIHPRRPDDAIPSHFVYEEFTHQTTSDAQKPEAVLKIAEFTWTSKYVEHSQQFGGPPTSYELIIAANTRILRGLEGKSAASYPKPRRLHSRWERIQPVDPGCLYLRQIRFSIQLATIKHLAFANIRRFVY